MSGGEQEITDKGKKAMQSSKSLVKMVSALLGCVVLAVSSQAAPVTPVQLQDGNSTAWIDVDSDMGMYAWNVDAINMLSQQWFWYRVGSGLQKPINDISAATWSVANGNQLTATYANSAIEVQVQYTLTGATSGKADIMETIYLKNRGASAADIHFYQYSDFDLMGTKSGDSVLLSGPFYDYALQWKGIAQIGELVIQPGADHGEAGLIIDPNPTLNRLRTVSDLVLSDVNTAGPGDATWALQWDFMGVGANGQVEVFKDKRLSLDPIPEPAAFTLIALALSALTLRRRL